MADISCSICRHKIIDTNYRITGISLAGWNGDDRKGKLPENVYRHKDCGSAIHDSGEHTAVCLRCHIHFWTTDSARRYCSTACEIAMASRALPVEEPDETSPTEEFIALIRKVDTAEAEAEPGSLKATINELASVPFVPKNEMGVVVLFSTIAKRAGYTFKHVGTRYPDALLCSPSNKIVRAEFEFVASNFIAHKHDPDECDMVICWEADKTLKPLVLALSNSYDKKSGTWNLKHMAFEKRQDELYA